MYVTKSTRSSKIFILGVWELREVLTRFCAFLTQGHSITSEIYYLNFIIISHRLTVIFSKRSYISIGHTYFVFGCLKRYIRISTIFGQEMAYFEGKILNENTMVEMSLTVPEIWDSTENWPVPHPLSKTRFPMYYFRSIFTLNLMFLTC